MQEVGFVSDPEGMGWHVIFRQDKEAVRSRLHALFTSSGLQIHHDVPRGKKDHKVKTEIGPNGLKIIIKLAKLMKRYGILKSMDNKVENTGMDKVKFWHPHLSNISPKAQIGDGTVVHAGVHIHDEVVIGKNCQIQAGALLFNGVTLEDEVFIGPGAIITNDPKLDTPRENWKATPTLIKKGSKIGAGAIIRAGVTIGENVIVGAGSVVLRDLEVNGVYVGNPARLLRFNKSTHYEV